MVVEELLTMVAQPYCQIGLLKFLVFARIFLIFYYSGRPSLISAIPRAFICTQKLFSQKYVSMVLSLKSEK
jgi:hypothetical protein